jgi:hypothetical protein
MHNKKEFIIGVFVLLVIVKLYKDKYKCPFAD